MAVLGHHICDTEFTFKIECQLYRPMFMISVHDEFGLIPNAFGSRECFLSRHVNL